MDREELIDEFIKADYETDLGMWKSCYIAWQLFNRFDAYSRDTVSVLKAACGLDYDAIYNRRNAWTELRTLFGKSVVFPNDVRLKASHFYRLYTLRRSINISDDEARSYLAVAKEYGWSSGTMCETIIKNHDPDAEKTFQKGTKKFIHKGWKIFEDSERLGKLGLPDDLMKRLYAVLKEIETWMTTKNSMG